MSAAMPVEAHGTGHSASAIDDERKVRLGMLFYVLTDVTFVIFLLVGYVWLRAYNVNGDWYPFKSFAVPDETTSLILVLLMVASGACYFVGYRAILAGNKMLLSIFATLALILTVVTLIGQFRFMGSQVFGPRDGGFTSEWLLLSGYHIYHLLIGTFLGIGLVNRAWRGRYTSERHIGVITIGYFWYWMALTPVLVLLLTTLLPPKI